MEISTVRFCILCVNFLLHVHVLVAELQSRKCNISTTLKVSVVLNKPYVSLKNTSGLEGNDQYEGFCVDVLDRIGEYCNMQYVIVPAKDKNYGNKNDTDGTWTGMVGEVMRGEADIAIGSLTITAERSEVVDFTVPFMNLGIGILVQKPQIQPPSLFTFAHPFTKEVWGLIVCAYVALCLGLWALSKLSPYEHINSDEHNFSTGNSCWYMIASLLQQGTEFDARALSTRILTATWWFFVLIIVSSYSANLTAFLTVKQLVSQITSAEDLSRQDLIQYGTLNSGSTLTFFKGAQMQPYQRMWSHMSTTKPSVFVSSAEEGVARVKKGNYALLIETTTLEYYKERDCDLMQIGGPLDSKGFGIALRKGSPYRELLSQAILYLQENTELVRLKHLWWKGKDATGECKDDEFEGQNSSLGVENLGGIFLVLTVGFVAAILVGIAERMYVTCSQKKRRLTVVVQNVEQKQ